MRSQTSSICMICLFFSSLCVLASNFQSFSSFQLQIPIRCNSLFRVLTMADYFFDYCMFSASAQYFCRGSIQNLNFIGWPYLNTLSSPLSSPDTKQCNEYRAPLSSNALLSSLFTFGSKLFSAPITYQPIRINSQQQFMFCWAFLIRRVQYSIIRATISEGLALLVPRGEVRVIVQESSCCRAQRRPQERPMLEGTFLLWQVVMPTRDMGLMSTSSI